jgi:hypothetical protein
MSRPACDSEVLGFSNSVALRRAFSERPNQRLLLPGPAASTFELVTAAGAAAPRSRSAIR